MNIQTTPYGTTAAGEPVEAYTLTSSTCSATIITYGATLTGLLAPDHAGVLSDVVLGFDHLHQYETQSPFFGATVGRFANRIAGGQFQLDGKTYSLAKNNGANHIHGGLRGYDKRVWIAAAEVRPRGASGPPSASVRFTLVDPDGAEGYPGTVNVSVTYTLAGSTLRIEYAATADKATPINLTNHSYFNLKDGGRDDVLSHLLQINADAYTPVDAALIPTGEIARVEGTAFDFTTAKPIGRHLPPIAFPPPASARRLPASAHPSPASACPSPAPAPPILPPGYDHNFVLRSQNHSLAHAATLDEPDTGRRMELWTTTPGLQLYTGNFLDGTVRGKAATPHQRHGGLSLECQDFPDAVNRPAFPSTVLRPGDTYRQVTEFRFSMCAK